MFISKNLHRDFLFSFVIIWVRIRGIIVGRGVIFFFLGLLFLLFLGKSSFFFGFLLSLWGLLLGLLFSTLSLLGLGRSGISLWRSTFMMSREERTLSSPSLISGQMGSSRSDSRFFIVSCTSSNIGRLLKRCSSTVLSSLLDLFSLFGQLSRFSCNSLFLFSFRSFVWDWCWFIFSEFLSSNDISSLNRGRMSKNFLLLVCLKGFFSFVLLGGEFSFCFFLGSNWCGFSLFCLSLWLLSRFNKVIHCSSLFISFRFTSFSKMGLNFLIFLSSGII